MLGVFEAVMSLISSCRGEVGQTVISGTDVHQTMCTCQSQVHPTPYCLDFHSHVQLKYSLCPTFYYPVHIHGVRVTQGFFSMWWNNQNYQYYMCTAQMCILPPGYVICEVLYTFGLWRFLIASLGFGVQSIVFTCHLDFLSILKLHLNTSFLT